MTESIRNAGGSKPRGRHGRFTQNPDTADRDAQACQLRRDCVSYPEIAARLGFASAGAAHDSVKRAMLAIIAEPAEDVRQMELERLDQLWTTALSVLRKRHYAHSGGKLVEAVIDGELTLLTDDKPTLDALDRLLRIQQRRAALLGLDAATKQEVGGKVTFAVEGVDLDQLR